jgi:hypothetical protein
MVILLRRVITARWQHHCLVFIRLSRIVRRPEFPGRFFQKNVNIPVFSKLKEKNNFPLVVGGMLNDMPE